MSVENNDTPGVRPFVIAIPSKGRLQENASAFFCRAGLNVVKARGARDYRGALEGVDNVEVAFLSSSDITAQLMAGHVHMGVTGEDLVRETIPDVDSHVALLAPLGFGAANVVVAVPEAWIDVRTMSDLADVAATFRAKHGRRMRVATKYVNSARAWFTAHGVIDYRIVESLGATEGAPAAGQAELIVDITTTGDTLKANALKVLDDGLILRSEANLAASLGADWNDSARETARLILSRIAAEEEARNTRQICARAPDFSDNHVKKAAMKFGANLIERDDGGRLIFSCARQKAPLLAEWLIKHGAGSVTIGAFDYIFTAKNVLWEKFVSRVG